MIYIYLDQMIYSYFTTNNFNRNNYLLDSSHKLRKLLRNLVKREDIIVPFSDAHIFETIPVNKRIFLRSSIISGLSKQTKIRDGKIENQNFLEILRSYKHSESIKDNMDIDIDFKSKKASFFGKKSDLKIPGLFGENYSYSNKDEINPLELIDKKLKENLSSYNNIPFNNEGLDKFIYKKSVDLFEMYQSIQNKVINDIEKQNLEMKYLEDEIKSYFKSILPDEDTSIIEDLFQDDEDNSINIPNIQTQEEIYNHIKDESSKTQIVFRDLIEFREYLNKLIFEMVNEKFDDVLLDTLILDIFGLYPDKDKEKNKHRKDPYWQELWDLQHLKEALYCDIFITADLNLYKRFNIALDYHNHKLKSLLVEESSEYIEKTFFA